MLWNLVARTARAAEGQAWRSTFPSIVADARSRRRRRSAASAGRRRQAEGAACFACAGRADAGQAGEGPAADRGPRRPAWHDPGRGLFAAVFLPAPGPCRRHPLCAGHHRQRLVVGRRRRACGAPCRPGCRRPPSGRWSPATTTPPATMAASGALYVRLRRKRSRMTPFGEKLRALRAERGVSQKEMAQALGVSAAYLSALEHGRRGAPTWTLIQKIIGYFNVIWDDAEELARLAEASHPRVKLDTSGLSPGGDRTCQSAGRKHREAGRSRASPHHRVDPGGTWTAGIGWSRGHELPPAFTSSHKRCPLADSQRAYGEITSRRPGR